MDVAQPAHAVDNSNNNNNNNSMSIVHRFLVENIEENDIVLTSEMEHMFSTSTSLYDVLTSYDEIQTTICSFVNDMKYMLTMLNYIK